jgi:hypothetical protein
MRKTQKEIVEAVLARHGRTYCAEIGIDIARNTPAPLFQLLVASLLFSARIPAEQAVEAARAERQDVAVLTGVKRRLRSP